MNPRTPTSHDSPPLTTAVMVPVTGSLAAEARATFTQAICCMAHSRDSTIRPLWSSRTSTAALTTSPSTHSLVRSTAGSSPQYRWLMTPIRPPPRSSSTSWVAFFLTDPATIVPPASPSTVAGAGSPAGASGLASASGCSSSGAASASGSGSSSASGSVVGSASASG